MAQQIFQHPDEQLGHYIENMSSTTDVAPSGTALPSTHSSRTMSWIRPLIVAAIAAIILGAVAAVLCIKFWPFSERAVIQALAESSDSTVTIRNYHPTYFPVPGCVLYGVEFRHGEKQADLITIQKLRILGSYSGVLTRRVPRIVAEGARVLIPPFGSKTKFHSQHPNVEIGEIVADGTVVQFEASEADKKPLTFDIHEALLTRVRWGSPIDYRLRFHNPNPPGEIAVSGKFGGWAEGHPEDTPLSGDFTFDNADLGVYGGIAGTLAAKGKFDGPLRHINVSGTTDMPDFEVQSSGNKVRLRTQFEAYVDGTNGDTFLNQVEAHLGRTTIVADGSVARSEKHTGKSANLRLRSRNGRIEDILGLFVSDPHSPMSGEISLQTRAEIPPGDEPFLEKLILNGAFGIDEGKFTHSDRQKSVDELSAGAQGKDKEDPQTALTDLKGKVALAHGVANLSELNFGVPGAHAQMHGTYNIIAHRIDLHGTMQVDTRISKTSSGMKALLLKMMDPIFKKRKKGEIVPVHIAGTYEKPEFGLDLSKPDDHKSPPK